MTTPPASPDSPDSPETPLLAMSDGEGPRHPRRRRIIKWTAIGVAVLLVVVAAGIAGDAYYLNSKIKTNPIVVPSGGPGSIRPSKAADATNAENFVLIGSDTRQGASGKGTGGSAVQGARSDTTIILHISANNAGATLISIPRDSYVQIPSCVVGPNNQTSAPEMSKFNAAYSIGGEYNNKYAASCTVHTIETLTGIPIDHYAVVDFAGFEKMVDALGGVKMCVAKPLDDPIVDTASGYHGSGLDLPQGPSVEIDGTQALALMRARYALDGGGDLPRIKRQQEFVAAMIRKATSSGLLIHPFTLQHFLSAAASSITTDGFKIGTMKKLASALHATGAGKIRLLTVPNTLSAPGLPYGDVEWDPTKAPELWNAIINDKPIPSLGKKKGPKLTVPPSSISVAVENGTTTKGLAKKAAQALEAQGYTVVSTGNSPTQEATTTVEYGPSKVQSSQTVAASLPGSVRSADASAGATITIVLGSNYTQVDAVTIGGSGSKISSLDAAKNSCLS